MTDKQKEISLKLKEGEIQYVKNLLSELKDKSKHNPDYWENKVKVCFDLSWKLLTLKETDASIFDYNYRTAKEILLEYIKLKPNVFEAYYYLAMLHDYFGETSKRDSLYEEILFWGMGDWNTALVKIKSKEYEEAQENLFLCIEKLSFFIDNVPSFYYAYKMRAKCFKILRKTDEENSDMENYNENYNKYGKQKVFEWTKKYNLE